MSISHFIKSTIFEVFFLLAKDNEIIDKMTAFGHFSDILQNLSIVFYVTIPWKSFYLQIVCLFTNLNITNPYMFGVSVAIVLAFLSSFGVLCYQVQVYGSISSSRMLTYTRYQYGLLSTVFFFPTVDQLLNYMFLDSSLNGIILTLACLALFIPYCAIVLLGSFLLFSPNTDPTVHIGRNSQRLDLLENVFKILISICSTFFEPYIVVLSFMFSWTTLFLVSLILPPFYNDFSNKVRSGVLFGLSLCSIGSLIVCFVPVYSSIWSFITLLLFVPFSFIGSMIYVRINESRQLSNAVYIFALKSLNKKQSGKKYRRLLRDLLDEYIITFWTPVQIVALTRFLCNLCVFKKDKFIATFGEDYSSEESLNIATPTSKSNLDLDEPHLSRSIIDLEHIGKTNRQTLALNLDEQFESVIRTICLQVYESGIRHFTHSAWLKAQYLIFLENANLIFPAIPYMPNIKEYADNLLNNTFLQEKSMDAHYILYSCYKKRVFDVAKFHQNELTNIVDIVAFLHDKEVFLDTISSLALSCKRFTEFIEKYKINFELIVTLATDIEHKWAKSKNYLRKGLSRVPTSPELLKLYREACFIIDQNTLLSHYLDGVLDFDFENTKMNGIVIEQQKQTLFDTPNQLSPIINRLYKTVEIFIFFQTLSLFLLFSFYYGFTIYYGSSQIVEFQSYSNDIINYGINGQRFYNDQYSFKNFQNSLYYENCFDDESTLNENWNTILKNPFFRSLNPSPFAAAVNNIDNGIKKDVTYEESNYIFQWVANSYLKSTVVNMDENLPNLQNNFFAFFLDLFLRMESNIVVLCAQVMNGSLVLFLVLLLSGIPICVFVFKKIKKDITKDSLNLVYSDYVKRFDLDLDYLQDMSETSTKNNFDVYKSRSIFSDLKLKFVLLVILYVCSGIIGYSLQTSAFVLLDRYYFAHSFIQIRKYFDLATTNNAYLYKSAKTPDHLAALKYVIATRKPASNYFVKASSPFLQNQTVNASPYEFWDSKQIKIYFGDECFDTMTCDSPALGHRAVAMTSKMLTTLKYAQWSKEIVDMQLTLMNTEQFSQSQLKFEKMIIDKFTTDNIVIETEAGVAVLFNLVLCIFVFVAARKIVRDLKSIHNRIKILKNIVAPIKEGKQVDFSANLLSQLTDESSDHSQNSSV